MQSFGFLVTLMMCMGHYEIISPIYKIFIKKNNYICSNNMLENGLMYAY